MSADRTANAALMVGVVGVMMGVPGADCGSYNDGVFVGGHSVLDVGRNEEVSANGIGFEMLEVQMIAEADFQGALKDDDASIRSVPVMFVDACGQESGIGEGFAG